MRDASFWGVYSVVRRGVFALRTVCLFLDFGGFDSDVLETQLLGEDTSNYCSPKKATYHTLSRL